MWVQLSVCSIAYPYPSSLEVWNILDLPDWVFLISHSKIFVFFFSSQIVLGWIFSASLKTRKFSNLYSTPTDNLGTVYKTRYPAGAPPERLYKPHFCKLLRLHVQGRAAFTRIIICLATWKTNCIPIFKNWYENFWLSSLCGFFVKCFFGLFQTSLDRKCKVVTDSGWWWLWCQGRRFVTQGIWHHRRR